MKLQGTLRRTLAMLLVLIFALSNMGLAEMADELADIPTAEPSIEEAALADAAPEAEQQEGEAEAPDEEEPVAEEAAVASSVTVEVMAIDETSLCAYEAIEPAGEYEVSYRWERAASADGEWEALDETSDVLTSEAEDRADYVYRCIVTVGDVTATSEPATFDWGAEEDAEEAPADLTPAANQIAAIAPPVVQTVGGISEKVAFTYEGGVKSGQPIMVNEKAEGNKITITAAAVSDDAGTVTYKWSMTGDAGTYVELNKPEGGAVDDSYTGEKVDVVIKEGATVTADKTVTIHCVPCDNGAEASNEAADATITILPVPTTTSLGEMFKFSHATEKNLVNDTTFQPKKEGSNSVTAKLDGLNANFTVNWSVDGANSAPVISTPGAWVTCDGDTTNTTTLTITEHSENNKFTSSHNETKGQKVRIKAEVTKYGTEKVSVTKDLILLPEATDVALTVDEEEIASADATVFNPITITANLTADTGVVEPGATVPCFGSVTGITVTGPDNKSAMTDTDEVDNTFTFTPETPGAYTVKAATSIDGVPSATDGKTLTVKSLPTEIKRASGSPAKQTVLADDKSAKTLALDFGTSEGTADKTGITWKVTGNSYGQGASKKDFFTFTPALTETGASVSGNSVQATLANAGLGTEANGGPVIVTAVGYVMPKEGESSAQRVEVTFELNVLPETSGTLIADDIGFDPDPPVIAQPTTSGDKAKSWARVKPTMKNTTFAAYDVTYEGATAADKKYIGFDAETGEIYAIELGSDNAINGTTTSADADGKKVNVKVTVNNSNVPAKKATVTVPITIRPVQTNISINQVVGNDVAGTTDLGAAANDTITVQTSAEPLKLKVWLDKVNGTTPYGKINKLTWVKQKSNEEDITPTPVDITKELGADGTLTRDVSEAGTYELKATSETGAERTVTIKALGKPNSLEVTVKDAQTSIYPGKTAELTVVPKDAQGNEAYAEDLVWTIGATGIDSDYLDPVQKDAVSAVSAGQIQFAVTDGGKKATLIVPTTIQDAAKKELTPFPTGAKINLTVSVNGGMIDPAITGFDLKAAVSEDITLSTTNIKITTNNYNLPTAAKQIAQGDTAKVEFVAGGTATADKIAPYNIRYSVSDPDAELTGDALKAWIDVDPVTGVITVPAEGKVNKLTESAKTKNFTIKVFIEGYEEGAATDTITVVSAPDDVTIKKKDGAAKDIPAVLTKGNTVQLTGDLVAPTGGYSTAGALPILSVDPDKSDVGAYEFSRDTADGKAQNTWTLTAKGDGKVTITATAWNGKTAKTPVTILLTDETEGLVTADGATCSGNNNKGHVWVVVDDTDGTEANKPNDDGHLFKCTKCNKYSTTRVKHENFEIQLEEGKTDDDLLIKGGQADAGKVVCTICGFECTHDNAMTANSKCAEYVDGTYHEAECPVCHKVVKEEHTQISGDGTCVKCGKSYANAQITNTDTTLIVGASGGFEPELSVTNTDSWYVDHFYIREGDEQYLEWVDETEGTVTGKAATPEDHPARLYAVVTVELGSATSQVEAHIDLTVREAVTSVTITADADHTKDGKAYMIDGDTRVITLTAEPNVSEASADLSAYKWKLGPSTNLEFVKEDAGGWVTDADGNHTGLVAHVRIASTKTIAATTSETVVFTNEPSATANDDDGKIDIELLPKAETVLATTFKKFITFNGKVDATSATPVQIIQGTSIPVTMEKIETVDGANKSEPFDDRYGTVDFSVEDAETVSDKKLNDADTKRWIEITGKSQTGATIETKALESSNFNALPNTGYKDFTVKVTVTAPWSTEAVPAETEVEQTVRIVSAPANVKFQYKTANDAAFKDVTSTGIVVDEGDSIDLKLVVVQDGTKPTISASDIAIGAIAESDGKIEETVDGYKLTVAKTGAADEITVSATCPGVSIDPITVKVNRLITDIELSCDVTEIGAGETVTDGVNTNLKSFVVSATVLPEGTSDKVEWGLYYKNEDGSIGDKITDTVNWTQTDDTHITVTMGTVRDDVATHGPEVIIKCEAVKSTEADGTTHVNGTHEVKIYAAPTQLQASTALELETEKAKETQGTNNGKLVLTQNESTKITKHGWKQAAAGQKQQFGSSPEAPVSDPKPVAAQNKPGTGHEGEEVLAVEPDGDDFVLTGKTVGSGQIEIHTYNNVSLTLDVVVTPAVTAVKPNSVVTLQPNYKLGIGVTGANAVTIPTNAWIAYRETTDASGATKEEVATDAAITLKSVKGRVEITKSADGKNWVLSGKEAGDDEIYAYVNETAQSEKIPVVIKDAPTAIAFQKDGEVVGAQLQANLETPTPIALTVVTTPDDAYGDITVTVDKETVVSKDVSEDGKTVTLTPVAAGTAVVEAKIPNPAHSGTDRPNNPESLTARVEIRVTEKDESQGEIPGPQQPSDVGIEIVGKQAIGKDETTTVVATGLKADESVTWSIDPATAATITPDPDNSKHATVAWVAAGKATVTATVGTTTATKDIYTLTEPGEITLNRSTPISMTAGETLRLNAECAGYDFLPELKEEAEETGVYPDYAGLFTYATSDTVGKYLKITTDDTGTTITAKAPLGKKVAAPTLTVTVKGGAAPLTTQVNITKKNTSFSIGNVNGSTLYMMPGDVKKVKVTTSPKNNMPNLVWSVTDDMDEFVEDITFEKLTDGVNIKVAEDAATEDAVYTVTVYAEGYTNHAEPSFTIVVLPKATAEDAPQLAVSKIGMDGSGYKDGMPAYGEVTVANKEKLQASFVDKDGNPIAGTVDWAQIQKSLKPAAKKKISISATGVITAKVATGSVELNASINGVAAAPIKINFTKAPAVELVPADTTRTVAVDEPFTLSLKADYVDTKATEWYSVSWTDNLDIEAVEDEEHPNTYTFGKPGVTTATLTTAWGSKKQVKFTVVDEEIATDFEVPETATVLKTGNVRIKATMEGYASLEWSCADGTAITPAGIKYGGSNKIKVKKVSNDEILITTTKAAVGTTIELVAKIAGEEEGKPIHVSIVDKVPGAQFPADTKFVFSKKVITKNEPTTVSLDFGENDAPVGTISYHVVKGSAGKASVKGNVIKGGAKAGLVTIAARLNGDAKTQITDTIYVLDAAKIETTLKPTTMGSFEDLTMDVNITNYVDTTVPQEFKEFVTTAGMLTAESNSPLITAEVSQEEDTEHPNQYQVTLHAGEAVKNAKGKFTSATVTLRLTNGQKKAMKIQVVEMGWDVYTPEEITVAAGMKKSLAAAVGEGAGYAQNFEWHIAEESLEDAARCNVSIVDGKVGVKAGTTATTTPDKPILIEDGYGRVIKLHVVAQKVKSNADFEVVNPGRTLYAGEKLLANVKFLNGKGGGDITWKSKRTGVISVDKKTGLMTVLGPTAKYSSAKIIATVNKKASKPVEMNVAPAPTAVGFKDLEKTYELTEAAQTINLYDCVTLNGQPLTAGADYSNVMWFYFNGDSDETNYDLEDGILTIPADAQEGAINVSVGTYNGLYADMLIVLGKGNGGGSETQPPQPEEKPAKTIALYLNNEPLPEAPSFLTLPQGETIEPTAVIKDEDGVVLTKAQAVWTSDDTTHITLASTTGILTAINHTVDPATGTQSATKIKVTAAVEGTDAKAEYLLQIEPNLADEHNFEFQVKRDTEETDTLFVGDGQTGVNNTTPVTAKVVFNVPGHTIGDVVADIDVEVDEADAAENKLTVTKNSGNSWNLTALKSGDVTLNIELTLIAAAPYNGQKIPIKKLLHITGLPTKDDLSILDKDGEVLTGKTLKVAETEAGKFEIKLDNFSGTLTDGDISIKAYQILTAGTGLGSEITNGITFAKQLKEGTTNEREMLKRTVTATDQTYPKFKVVVSVFENRLPKTNGAVAEADKIQQEFTVEVADAPTATDITVTADKTMQGNAASKDYAVTLGYGETVKLSAALATGKEWVSGLTWSEESTYAPDEKEANKLHWEPVEGENAITVTYNPETPPTITPALKMRVSCNGSSTLHQDVQFTFKAVPTATNITGLKLKNHDSSSPISATETITLGVGQKLNVEIDFPTNVYTSDVRWSYANNIKMTAKEGYWEFVGTAPMTSGYTTVTAYYGSLSLGSFQMFIKKAPEMKDLVLKEYNDSTSKYDKEFSFKLSKSATTGSELKVGVVLPTDVIGTLNLDCPGNKCVKVEADTVGGKTNCWKITWNSAASSDGGDGTATSATLVLTNADNGLTKRINITIVES